MATRDVEVVIGGKTIVVRAASPEEIIDLRHAVLRQGLPRQEAIFDGDELPTTRHSGAFTGGNGTAVGCATMLLNAWEGEPAWQLRGMATAPVIRGKGLGRLMLQHLEFGILDALPPAAPRLLWCNARVPAVGFYESLGWRVVSERFEIPTAGPHVKMVRRLDL
ncbi:MAG TPA: GNAT family N-acetyltransferase [Tepidisphaeraceae bacterium]|nr:GNAT family N-acetyltransferase [Tepidisphaeraceae bacterium]